MKIDIISDVHLEFGDLVVENRNDADVLVMAGDICVAKDLHNYPEDDVVLPATSQRSAAAARYRAFFRRVCEVYPNVIFIAGNHEHYHGKFDKTHDIFHTEFERMGLPIQFLEREKTIIDGVTFIGSTLWSSFNDMDPVSMFDCQQKMNDYRVIKVSNEGFRALRPMDTVKEFTKTVRYIDETVKTTTGPVVIVGHHAPSDKSVMDQYKDDVHVNGAYRSDLEWMMLNHTNIKLWVHGHTHHTFDYMVNQTRVVCNPRGYVNYERGSQEEEPYYPLTVEI